MQDLYIGNLPYTFEENDIQEIFEPFGAVLKVTLIKDHQTGRKKGYGFVRIDLQNPDSAIEKLDRTEQGGRTIRVGRADNH